MALLAIRDLVTQFKSSAGPFNAVNGVTLEVERGEMVGLVGESGCGKSLTLRSIVRVLPRGARIAGGQILYEGNDIAHLSSGNLTRFRGREISMILQDPMSALNPVYTVGAQLMETLRETRGLRGKAARQRAIELLRLVNIPDPERRLESYPHQLSGGLSQRVVIAIALCAQPKVLLADEPTTALDVTVQAQILKLLKDLQKQLQMAVLLVTHDLGLVAQTCSRVAIMYAGRVIEEGTVEQIFESPRHPYTVGLIESIPLVDGPLHTRLPAIPGSPPNMAKPIIGCAFAPRCPLASNECREGTIPLYDVAPQHRVACGKHALVSKHSVIYGVRANAAS
ncbi:MAG: peptide transporter ATP-binding protein [Chloroflexi bacterium]|nr:peptide transporter ATP-binding protein [Chloroflexota bacterium]